MNARLVSENFPKFRESKRAFWAPLIFEPYAGSFERFVVGVVAASDLDYHIELANSLARIDCLYSAKRGTAMRFAIDYAAASLNRDLSKRLTAAITNPEVFVSGVSLGQCREGEGLNVRDIASSWLAMLSSFHDREPLREQAAPLIASVPRRVRDGVSALVLENLELRNSSLIKNFAPNIRLKAPRHNLWKRHQIRIDYFGQKIVANFVQIATGKVANSSAYIKERFWELDVTREQKSLFEQSHNMLVMHQNLEDASISDRQRDEIKEAIDEFRTQAKHKGVGFKTATSVSGLADFLILNEAA